MAKVVPLHKRAGRLPKEKQMYLQYRALLAPHVTWASRDRTRVRIRESAVRR